MTLVGGDGVDGIRSEEMQCNWRAIQPINETNICLYLEELHTCGMTGAIKLCKKVLPKVKNIFVFSGQELDVKYWIDESGEWKSGRPPKGVFV